MRHSPPPTPSRLRALAAAALTIACLVPAGASAQLRPVHVQPTTLEPRRIEPTSPNDPTVTVVPGQPTPMNQPRIISPRALPSMIDADTQRVLAERIAPALFEVRTLTDQGPNFRPRYTTGTGAATLVRFGDAAPVLITSFAHLAFATTVEVRVGDQWFDAELAYEGAIFDMAVLRIDAELDPDAALTVANAWAVGATVYAPAGDADAPEMVIGALGPPPSDDYAYYVRGLFTQYNGRPIVTADGELVAVLSIYAPDGAGGVLAIPWAQLWNWRLEWPQLNTEDPVGWRPRVIRQELDLTTGSDALGPNVVTPE